MLVLGSVAPEQWMVFADFQGPSAVKIQGYKGQVVPNSWIPVVGSLNGGFFRVLPMSP